MGIQYHFNPELYEGFRIVGFEVEPRSSSGKDAAASCAPGGAAFDLDANSEIIFTYDVRWQYSEVRWVSRWDAYLKMSGAGRSLTVAQSTACSKLKDLNSSSVGT